MFTRCPTAVTSSSMLPGVNHCGGGAGPDSFDAVAALEKWFDTGRAPARIVASSAGKAATRTRPLCPYPARPSYIGKGAIDRAENFRCAIASQ